MIRRHDAERLLTKIVPTRQTEFQRKQYIYTHIPEIYLFHLRGDNCPNPLTVDAFTLNFYRRLFYRNYKTRVNFGQFLRFVHPSLLGLRRCDHFIGKTTGGF